jgi:integrase
MICADKSMQTIDAYLKRGEQLWNRAAKATEVRPEHLCPSKYYKWLESILPNLKPATRRQYIASTRAFILSLRSNTTGISCGKNELSEIINKCWIMQSFNYAPDVKYKQWRGNTSSQKTKKVRLQEIAVLAEKSKNKKGKWIKPALIWMSANILVGLRPIEWRQAYLKFENSKIILVVMNAKNTNSRSNGQFRNLDITDLEEAEITRIKTQLSIIKYYVKDDLSWNTYYSGVRHSLHLITREYLPNQRKYPSLYSTRHQFAANAKSEGMSKAEVAALMGHAVDTTASMHYGKKKHGSGKCFVRPDVQEVQKVQINSVNRSNNTFNIKYS